MTTRQISETIEDIYGFETSEGFISDVTDKILPHIEDWQNRPLDEVYPILYIDAIHYSVRDNGVIRKLAAYIILGINTEGKKEVLTINVGDNESSKYPNSMKRWKDNWDAISPIFKFSATVRKVIYTTNAIESLNSTYRKVSEHSSSAFLSFCSSSCSLFFFHLLHNIRRYLINYSLKLPLIEIKFAYLVLKLLDLFSLVVDDIVLVCIRILLFPGTQTS